MGSQAPLASAAECVSPTLVIDLIASGKVTSVLRLLVRWAGLLLVIGAVAELALLVVIASAIGAEATALWLLGSAVGGSAVARRKTRAAWREVRAAAARGESPAQKAVDALGLFAAGLLLVIPGLLSDIAGCALFIPSVRRFFGGMMSASAVRHMGGDFRMGRGPLKANSHREPPVAAPDSTSGAEHGANRPTIEGEVIQKGTRG